MTHRLFTGSTVLLTALAAGSVGAAADDSQAVDLRARWVKGHQQHLTMNMSRTTRISVDGREIEEAPGAEPGKPVTSFAQESILTQTAGLLFRVADVGENRAVVELTITEVQMTMKDASGTYEFDSRTPKSQDSGNRLAEGMRPVVGCRISIVLDQEGHVTSVTGQQNCIAPGQMGQLAMQLVGPGLVKSRWGPMLAMRTGTEPVKVGETWRRTEEIDGGPIGRLSLITDSTLKSADAKEANVIIAGAFHMPESADSEAGFAVTQSAYDGNYVFNIADGLIDRAIIRQAFSAGSKDTSRGSLSISTDTLIAITRGRPGDQTGSKAKSDKPSVSGAGAEAESR